MQPDPPGVLFTVGWGGGSLLKRSFIQLHTRPGASVQNDAATGCGSATVVACQLFGGAWAATGVAMSAINRAKAMGQSSAGFLTVVAIVPIPCAEKQDDIRRTP